MRFAFHPQAGDSTLCVEGELFVHLFRARRKTHGEFAFRNLVDDNLYMYALESLGRKSATLQLQSCNFAPNKPAHALHLLCAIIDNKAIERDLPLLNEFGAAKLTFFPAELSQNFRIDIERLERIARHSSEQCGRSDCVQIALAESLDSLLHSFPQAAVFDFGGESLAQCAGGVREILIGAEGGFSEKEREKMRHLRKLSSGELVLRASSAAVFAQANAWRIVGDVVLCGNEGSH